MKKGGVKLAVPQDIVVFQRGDNQLVFNVKGIASMDEFEKLAPEPKPPMMRKPNGQKVADPEDPAYLKAVEQHGMLRASYIVVKSLEDDDIEWENVKLDRPDTWELWHKELEDAGMTQFERNYLLTKIFSVNGIGSEDVYKQVRDNFLANQAAKTQPPSN